MRGMEASPVVRAARLNRIIELLNGAPGGLTTRELAEMTGVHHRSIERDLNAIRRDLYVDIEKTKNRYRVRRPERLPRLDLNVQEARALLIASRLFLRYSDEVDLHATNALAKLGRILPDAVRPHVQAAAEALATRPLRPEFTNVMATVTEAWANGRTLRISYRSAGRQRPKDVEVQPYFIEPSAAGFSTYLIGYSKTHGGIRTFKVERIVSAEKLPEHFDLPVDVKLDELLASAWGIWWAGDGVQVRMRFSRDVAWRVRESRWHPSQQLDEQPDGGVVLTVHVPDTTEIGRWIRSWGDTVEVLAPQSLRDELRDEAVRLARQYTRRPARAARKRVASARAQRDGTPVRTLV